MATLTKKKKSINESYDANKIYTIAEAVEILKKFTSTKFTESVDVSVNLGIDARKSDQAVRSSTNLPRGNGKTVKVAVFAQGENAEKATKAGADVVGFEDLAEKMKAGDTDFDVIIATPDAMAVVGRLGQILGPKGLMPNPKVGTVTVNVAQAIENAKSGQVRYRTDKNGIIHCSVGNINFSADDIMENITALLNDLRKAKPASSKGKYLKKLTISSTMGPGITVDLSTVSV